MRCNYLADRYDPLLISAPSCQMSQEGNLTKVECSVRLNTLCLLVKIRSFIWEYFLTFNKTSYLNEEVNFTKPSPQLAFPGPRLKVYISLTRSCCDNEVDSLSSITMPMLSIISMQHVFGNRASLLQWATEPRS